MHDERLRLLVVTVRQIILKHIGRLDGKRTVDIDLESVVALHHVLRLDDAEHVEKLLRPAHGKCGNHHIAAPVQRPLDNIRKDGNVVRYPAVKPVAIRTFHYHVIRVLDILRIPDQRLVLVADITGKYDLLRNIILCDPHLNGGRPQ